ncbi:uncharacterized protein LOC121136415 [Mesocricetus auratus]|uniref:Uncharacterized protein LOC121136415 n=1 Tax=Mesocricetus auratus TaxID=10036 RepID=A0ABM2WWV9_MESAU|nr:uncharacterized protein LOC121136415 [Mesocricetus auratus]
MEKLEELTIKLQSIKNEQIELSAILESYTKIDFYNRLKSFEMMKKVHKQVMCDLQRFPLEISDNLNKCKQLIEENNKCYSFLHRIGLPDLTQLKNNVNALKQENEKLSEEQIALQETCEEVKKLLKEVQEKICDPCAEQHQPAAAGFGADCKCLWSTVHPPHRFMTARDTRPACVLSVPPYVVKGVHSVTALKDAVLSMQDSQGLRTVLHLGLASSLYSENNVKLQKSIIHT